MPVAMRDAFAFSLRAPGGFLLTFLSKLQASLLAAAATCVRPGGTLIYSVCSPRYEETDAAVERFLQQQPSFELLPAPPELAPFAAENGAAVRTWTHLHPADSHFAVRLRRGS